MRRRVLALTTALSTLVGAGVIAIAAAPAAQALPDGLALTPPMGFNNWNTTACRAEFNEAMVKGIADIFVSKGLKDAGYEYVNIDDCWAEKTRDAQGKLVPHKTRFPNGIKAVADYVHSKGLKFGIYTSAGIKTCNKDNGFPGGLGHEDSDAAQFASWGVDYLKWCWTSTPVPVAGTTPTCSRSATARCRPRSTAATSASGRSWPRRC